MVFSHRATVYLWSLHFYSQMFKKRRVTQPPVQLELSFFFFFCTPPRSLIAPMAPPQEVINSSHYSFDKNTHFQRQADLRTETNGPFPAPSLRLSEFSTLSLLQHFKVNNSSLTRVGLIIDPMFSQVFPPIFLSSSSLLTSLCSQRFFFCRHLALRLHFRLEPHANPCLDCGLTGF